MDDFSKVSGLLITKNEEKNIAEVLACLSFCEEIIVVDSFSTDRTLEIARKNTKVKIIQNKFQDFTSQRNIAVNAAKNDWIIFLDGDERITPKLRTEIIRELKKSKKKDAYYFYRKFYFEGKPIHFCGTRNDKNFRLFRKSKAHYTQDKKVHETLEVNGEIGFLKNKLLHYSVENAKSYREKMLHYGKLKGEELASKGKRYSIFTQYSKTFFKFFKTYILKFGFLDGKNGFLLSKMQSEYVFETYNSLRNEQNH